MKTTEKDAINISDYDYPLPEHRIAKFPTDRRGASKLLIYENGSIRHSEFSALETVLPEGSLLVFNNTKVVRARIVMHKPSGARIEILCLEPQQPADYERALASSGSCRWKCMIGNLKKWKEGPLEIEFDLEGKTEKLSAFKTEQAGVVEFRWQASLTFGQLLEMLGRMPIPPYLNRDSEEIDNSRYQTVYAKIEGSVAAPTAGLHFTSEIMTSLQDRGVSFDEVTLHVGAGTFLPVKETDALRHTMHTEHFEVSAATVKNLLDNYGRITAVGTTSVRTLESLTALGWRIHTEGAAQEQREVGQWELYDIPESYSGKEALSELYGYMLSGSMKSIRSATQIMITPAGFRFRIVDNIITNFHQPKSTLLLLIAAYVGQDWHRIYDYALEHDFRFLSYGDSSILINHR